MRCLRGCYGNTCKNTTAIEANDGGEERSFDLSAAKSTLTSQFLVTNRCGFSTQRSNSAGMLEVMMGCELCICNTLNLPLKKFMSYCTTKDTPSSQTKGLEQKLESGQWCRQG